jgi:cytochrome b involved in lipid metabolism
MKKLYIVISILVLVLVSAAAFAMLTKEETPQTTVNQSDQTSESTDINLEEGYGNDMVITKDVLAEHSTKDDCWTAISGKVYDITKYIPRHPGGDEILLACGTDGTSLFTQRQTADGQDIGSGTPHSSSATNQLEAYFIGDFDNN